MHPGSKSEETVYDSDGASVLPDSNSDLFDLNIECESFYNDNESKDRIEYSSTSLTKTQKLQKLKISKLDSISIPSTVSHPQPIVNLKQSFTFSSPFKPSNEISTQTSQLNLMNRFIITGDESSKARSFVRGSSLPPENAAMINLEKRVQADVKPKNFPGCQLEEMIGDGRQIQSRQSFEHEQDLEVSDCIPPIALNLKSKASRMQTPKFTCKKIRPQTRHPKKRTSQQPESDSGPDPLQATCVKSHDKASLKKKPENLRDYEMASDISTDGGLDVGANYHTKLNNVVDKLQDYDW